MKEKIKNVLNELRSQIQKDEIDLDRVLSNHEFVEMKYYMKNYIFDFSYLVEYNLDFIKLALSNITNDFLIKYNLEIEQQWLDDFLDSSSNIKEDLDWIDFEDIYLCDIEYLRKSYTVINYSLNACRENAISKIEEYQQKGNISDIKESSFKEALNLLEESLI